MIPSKTRFAAEPDSQAGRPADIERVSIDALDAELFTRNYRRQGRPVVITGLFAGVPPWTLDYLGEYLSGAAFDVREFEDRRNRLPKPQWSGYANFFNLPFDDYVQMLKDGTATRRDIYLGQAALPQHHPLVQTIDDRFALLQQRCGFVRRLWKTVYAHLWLGPAGHTEPLHSDEGDGTLCQLYGTKRVVLFPASRLFDLYPFPLFSRVDPWVSRVDLHAPDYQRYPRLAAAMAERLELELQAGEVLYLPAQWSHEISVGHSTDFACSISCMWDIPFRRNFVNRRTVLWYLLRVMPDAVSHAAYAAYARILRLRRQTD